MFLTIYNYPQLYSITFALPFIYVQVWPDLSFLSFLSDINNRSRNTTVLLIKNITLASLVIMIIHVRRVCFITSDNNHYNFRFKWFQSRFFPEYTWSWRHASDCVNHFSCDFLSSKSKLRIINVTPFEWTK